MFSLQGSYSPVKRSETCALWLVQIHFACCVAIPKDSWEIMRGVSNSRCTGTMEESSMSDECTSNKSHQGLFIKIRASFSLPSSSHNANCRPENVLESSNCFHDLHTLGRTARCRSHRQADWTSSEMANFIRSTSLPLSKIDKPDLIRFVCFQFFVRTDQRNQLTSTWENQRRRFSWQK